MRFALSILLLSCLGVNAQLWLGTISEGRAVDWTNAGAATVTYSIQYTSYTASATAAQIQTGLNNCPAGQYVLCQAGLYALNNGLTIKNGTALYGEGANATKFIFSAGVNCSFANDTCICIGNGDVGAYGPNWPDARMTAQTWAAGYTPLTNVIKLNSVSGLSAGMLLFLDQLDDTVDGYPSAGDLVMGSATANNFSKQGGANFHRSGRNMAQITRVTSISGTNVTIDPVVYYPAIRSAKTPEVWYSAAGTQPRTNAALKNVSIDWSAVAGYAVLLFNTANCEVSGNRFVNTNAAAGECWQMRNAQGVYNTIKNNYIYGPSHNTINQYGYTESMGCRTLYLNNIGEKNGGIYEFNGNSVASVWAYNFGTNSWVNFFVEHDTGNIYNLFEGNIGSGQSADVVHGTGALTTSHRNGYYGGATAGTGDNAFWLSSYRRFFNLTGNVMGKNNTVYKHLEAQAGTDVLSLGQNNASESGAGNPPTDPYVSSTAFLWGNWNNVSNTVLWLNAEVPSSISYLSNAIPAAQTVPASYLFNSKPTNWFGTTWDNDIPFPPIGPEVSGGDFSYSGNGHINETPAYKAWRNLPNDSRYGALNVREFNATNYVASAAEAGGGSTVVNTSSLSGGTRGLSVSGNLSIR
jgi:hypothetical protein